MKPSATLLSILCVCLVMLGCSKQNTPSTGSSDGQASDAQASVPSSNWTYETIPGNSFNPPVLTATTISPKVQSINSDGSRHDIKLVISYSTKDDADAISDVKATQAVVKATATEKADEKADKAAYDLVHAISSCALARFGISVTKACDNINTDDDADHKARARRDAADAALATAEDNVTKTTNALAVADATVDNDGIVSIVFEDDNQMTPGRLQPIEVRFDDGAVQTLDAFIPGNSAHGAIFVKDSIDFISQIAKAKRVAFNIPVAGQYEEVDFNVSGLDMNKLSIK